MDKLTSSTSFDGLHALEFIDGKRRRYILDGKQVPGATTVGAMYPKGEGLIRWMIKQGLEEHEKKTKLAKAADIGRIVHEYAYCNMSQKSFNWGLVDGSEDAQIIRDCIRQYDEWANRHVDDRPYAAELLIGSPSLRVASFIDLVLYRDAKVIIRDYKTGKKIYISALHQTILYKRMLREWLDIEANELEILKFSKEPETVPFESCVITNDGINLNGTMFPVKDCFQELEDQTMRNVATYRHTKHVEKILTDYYDAQYKK